jgi:hypothetical protein
MMAGAPGFVQPATPMRSAGTTGAVRVCTTPGTRWISEITWVAIVARSWPSTWTITSQPPTTALARRAWDCAVMPASTSCIVPGSILR